jgi:hypothetical protein
MDEKARSRAVTAMVDKLRADMLAAIDKMPDDFGGPRRSVGTWSVAPS